MLTCILIPSPHGIGRIMSRNTNMTNSENFVPLALILEHDFAEKTDWRHAVAEQLVMEFLQ